MKLKHKKIPILYYENGMSALFSHLGLTPHWTAREQFTRNIRVNLVGVGVSAYINFFVELDEKKKWIKKWDS